MGDRRRTADVPLGDRRRTIWQYAFAVKRRKLCFFNFRARKTTDANELLFL